MQLCLHVYNYVFKETYILTKQTLLIMLAAVYFLQYQYQTDTILLIQQFDFRISNRFTVIHQIHLRNSFV